VNVIGAPWHRAEILRALHKLTAGVPLLTPTEAQGMLALPKRAFVRAAADLDALGWMPTDHTEHTKED